MNVVLFTPRLSRRMQFQSVVCGKGIESVGHVVRDCTGLLQREYQRRHDQMG